MPKPIELNAKFFNSLRAKNNLDLGSEVPCAAESNQSQQQVANPLKQFLFGLSIFKQAKKVELPAANAIAQEEPDKIEVTASEKETDSKKETMAMRVERSYPRFPL
jgi:hypothetical protein